MVLMRGMLILGKNESELQDINEGGSLEPHFLSWASPGTGNAIATCHALLGATVGALQHVKDCSY